MSQFTCVRCGSTYYNNMESTSGDSPSCRCCICTACQGVQFQELNLTSANLNEGQEVLVRVNGKWMVGVVEFLDLEKAIPGIRYGDAIDQIASINEIEEAYSCPE